MIEGKQFQVAVDMMGIAAEIFQKAFMSQPPNVPEAVLNATLPDGRLVVSVVDTTDPYVTSMAPHQLASFYEIWQTRREIDIPTLLELGHINAATANAWTAHLTDLLRFIDMNKQSQFQLFSFVGVTAVLFASESARAFVIDLPEKRE